MNGERANATHKYVDKQDETISVTLKEYIDMRFKYLEGAINDAEKAHDAHQEEISKALDARFQAQEKAISVATAAHDRRLDSMNEFRETLRDQNKTFITRMDHDALITSYQKDVDALERALKTEAESLESSLNTKSEAMGKEIESLKLSRAELAGKASQSQLNLTFIFTLISFVIGLAGLILGFFGH